MAPIPCVVQYVRDLPGHGYPCINAGHPHTPTVVRQLFYADDLTIANTTSPDQLQETLHVVEQFMAARDQLLSPPQCVALRMGQPGQDIRGRTSQDSR